MTEVLEPDAPTEHWERVSLDLYRTPDFADYLRVKDRNERAGRAGLCQCCIGILSGPGGTPRQSTATTVYTTGNGYRVLLCDPCRDVWVAEDATAPEYARARSVVAL